MSGAGIWIAEWGATAYKNTVVRALLKDSPSSSYPCPILCSGRQKVPIPYRPPTQR
jgi:hypothetical protein